jgi:hypothetical protein
VYDQILHSDWDVILFAIPFVGLFLLSLFRMDELIISPKKKARTPRAAYWLDRDGETLMCDPDGRSWSRAGRRK